MDNKILEKLLKNVDYDTYIKLDKIAFNSFAYSAFNPVVLAILDAPLFEFLLSCYVLLAQSYYCSICIYDGEKYTKDIIEIKKLYYELIDKYIELINSFNFEHPVEIHTIYNYMLKKGLLSNPRHFVASTDNIDDIRSLLGVNVVAGEGLCRHIASMLNDIYNRMNYNSCTQTVYLNTNKFLYDKINIAIKEVREKIKEKNYNISEKEAIELLNELKKQRKIYNPRFEPIQRISGNHLITLVSRDNVGYALDPSNNIIYKKDTNNEYKNILKTPLVSPTTGNVLLTRIHSNSKQKSDILLLPNSTCEEDELIINNTKNICVNNLDLLFNFKNENKGLYEEIANKLVKIKKK